MDFLNQTELFVITADGTLDDALNNQIANVGARALTINALPIKAQWFESPERLILIEQALLPAFWLDISDWYRSTPGLVRTVLFNVDPHSTNEKLALLMGMHGVFFQDTAKEDFQKGLEQILLGDRWYRRQLLSAQVDELSRTRPTELNGDDLNPSPEQPCQQETLSKREWEVLKMIRAGASNKSIANQLSISVHTVRTHTYRIYRKTHSHNRIQAMQWAMTHDS